MDPGMLRPDEAYIATPLKRLSSGNFHGVQNVSIDVRGAAVHGHDAHSKFLAVSVQILEARRCNTQLSL
jgi:hypothetical protein